MSVRCDLSRRCKLYILNGVYVCVCFQCRPVLPVRHLEPPIQRIKAELWPIFNFCTTSAGRIAGWWLTVGMRRVCVLYYNLWVRNMRWERVKTKPGAGISLHFSKSTKRQPGLQSPSDGRIVINNAYALTSYALQRDLGLNPVIFGIKKSNPG